MAQYEHEIDKHTDWGGDESTGGLQVAGTYVQKFIKDTLETKIGFIVEDKEHNKFLGFSDEENYTLYVTDPIRYQDLIVDEWAGYFPDVPPTLDHPVYYGPSSEQITIDTASTKMLRLAYTTDLSAVCRSNREWVYVAVYVSDSFVGAITKNSENVLDRFINMGRFYVNGSQYDLYEFHLSSGLPLNVDINIQFNKG